MARSLWRRIALPVVLSLFAVACNGGAGQDPQDQLVDALRTMSTDPGVTVTLSLDTDEESLRRIAEAEGETLSPEVAALLLTGSLGVSVPFDPAVKAVALALRLADADVAELRAVDDTVYVRADVPALLSAAGQDAAMAEGVRGLLAQSGVVPPEVVDGRWLALAGVTQMAEAMSGSPVDNPLDQVQARRAMERFVEVLAGSSSVTRVGSDADGEHLRAAVPLREVYAAFMAEAEALGLPGGTASDVPSVDEVPDETVAVDLWVRDGRLSLVSIDAAQFGALDPEAPQIPEGARLAVRLRLERFDGVVQVPADAARLDVNGLMQLIMGGMGMAFGGSMAGITPPGMPPGMPPAGMVPPAP